MADIVIHDDAELLPQGNRRKRGKKIVEDVTDPSRSSVVYVGRIPHGFYERQMRDFFEQFGSITKLRISRNKQTGKPKHYAFIQFELPDVAEIVAESMNNYLLFESMLQVKLVPVEKFHPKMWVGANREYRVGKFQLLQKMQQNNKVRTPAEQKRLLQGLLKKDKQRQKKLIAAGIDYEFPDIRGSLPERPKKIKFEYDA